MKREGEKKDHFYLSHMLSQAQKTNDFKRYQSQHQMHSSQNWDPWMKSNRISGQQDDNLTKMERMENTLMDLYFEKEKVKIIRKIKTKDIDMNEMSLLNHTTSINVDQIKRRESNIQFEQFKIEQKVKQLGSIQDQQIDGHCQICLFDYDECEAIICLPCGHSYHQDCMLQWVGTRSDCRSCNFNIHEYLRQSCD